MVKNGSQSQGFKIPSTYFLEQHGIKLMDVPKLHETKLINWPAIEAYRKKWESLERGSSEKKIHEKKKKRN